MLNRGYEYRERLDGRAEGRTLLAYLTRRYAHSSEAEWRERIETGRVLVEGERVPAHRELTRGETLVWARPPWREPWAPSSFAVLYRDADLLAVAKPVGLPTLPGGGFLENTLLAKVKRFTPQASPLHRIGRATSGVVLFALNAEARRWLTALWTKGGIERRYRAIARGLFPEGERELSYPIGPVPHALLGSVAGVSAEGKAARSRVRLVEHRGNTSLVEIAIETGRTHQIRIHLSAFGYPLVGDPLYPTGGVPAPDTDALPGDPGFQLHAYWMRFRHPRTSAEVRIECGPPPPYRGSSEP